MTENAKKAIIALVKSAITGQPCEVPSDVDLVRLYKFARKQNIIPLMYYGMVNSGFGVDTEIGEQFFLTTCQYISVAEQQDSCIASLLEEFDRESVKYMPLKGTTLRALYPKSEMRAMGDSDILIDLAQYDVIKPIMERLGYAEGVESDHELVWLRDCVCIELHKRLIPSYNKDYYAYFGDGWNKAEPIGNSTRYSMSDEDNLIYLLTHFAKHFRDGGIGIKHLVDIKLYLDQKTLDFEYLGQQFEKLKLWEFFKNLRRTIEVWFDGAVEDEVTVAITERILSGGAFGQASLYKASDTLKKQKSGKNRNRFQRFMLTVFLPYKNMCLLFPVLKKMPVLLPFFWVWRIIYTALNKKGTLTKHYNAIKSLSPENLEQYERELNAVGLYYCFEEED